MKKIVTKKQARIPFTKVGYQKVLDEKEALRKERPDAVEHLRKAREMGDLSENGYYKEARSRLSTIDRRLRQIERLVRLGTIVESRDTGKVEIGSRVTINNGKRELVYSIVGGYESDPTKGTISHKSPIGRALMGKSKDDIVVVRAPAGEITYKILTIEYAE